MQTVYRTQSQGCENTLAIRPLQGYGNTAPLSYPNTWVRKPDCLHLPYSPLQSILHLSQYTYQDIFFHCSKQGGFFFCFITFSFFYCSITVVPIFHCCSPLPHSPPAPTVDPHPVVHVHRSFIPVPWLDPSPSFSPYSPPSSPLVTVSFKLMKLWCLSVLLPFFVSLLSHQQNISLWGLFSTGETKNVAWARWGEWGRWGTGVRPFLVKNCWPLSMVWAGVLVSHPSLNGQTQQKSLQKIFWSWMQPLTTMPACADWFLEHSPNRGSLYYKVPTL